MACFLAPAAEAVVTTVISKAADKKGKEKGISFSRKIKWLSNMLWGGSALLAFEHVWHGEIIPTFPFLTAVAEGNTAGMLEEIATNGIAMAVLITAVWVCMVGVTHILEKTDTDAEAAR